MNLYRVSTVNTDTLSVDGAEEPEIFKEGKMRITLLKGEFKTYVFFIYAAVKGVD